MNFEFIYGYETVTETSGLGLGSVLENFVLIKK